MNARIVTTATLFATFAGVLVAKAADSQLLSLVMPDAKVLAGVNVDQAKGTPFGNYLLSQLPANGGELQKLIAVTGFDPTRDVHEVLAATSATPGSGKTPTGLVLARGNFDPAAITAAATSQGGLTEVHSGVTIIEDPKKVMGIAFLDNTLVVAGDVANVKAAIDRPSTGLGLPASVIAQVNQWSAMEDAWVVMTVPPSSLMPAPTAGATPNPMSGVLQQIQQIAGGVKFGDLVVGTASIQSDTPANATQLGNTLQFLLNLLQMQTQGNAQVTNLAQAVAITAQGNTVKITATLPQAQFQQLIQQQKKVMNPAAHVKVAK